VFRFDNSIDSLISEIRAFGTVIALWGVLARHVELRGLPKHARPGRSLQSEPALSADYPCTAPAQLEAAAASHMPHMHVDVSMVCLEVSQPQFATLVPAAGGRGMVVSVLVPESAGRDSKLVIRFIRVAAGETVTYGESLPAHVGVVTGMLAPLRLYVSSNVSSPVVSGDCRLCAPRLDTSDVLVFSA
jgi:hypothetical protein